MDIFQYYVAITNYIICVI